jgi:hypothetical protein
LNIIVFIGTSKKEAKNACASGTLAQNPFTIKKDRPENSLFVCSVCSASVTLHLSPVTVL